MKKRLILFAVIGILLCTSACGKESESVIEEKNGEAVTEETEIKEETNDVDADLSPSEETSLYFPMPDVLVNNHSITLGKTTYEEMQWSRDEYKMYFYREVLLMAADGTKSITLHSINHYDSHSLDGVSFSSYGALPEWKDMISVRTDYLKEHADEFIEGVDDKFNLEDAYFLQKIYEMPNEKLEKFVNERTQEEFDKGNPFSGASCQVYNTYVPQYDPAHFVVSEIIISDINGESDVTLSHGPGIGSSEKEVLDYYGYTDEEFYKSAQDYVKKGFISYRNSEFIYSAPDCEYSVEYKFKDGKVSVIVMRYQTIGRIHTGPATIYVNMTPEEITEEEKFLRDGHYSRDMADSEPLPLDSEHDDTIEKIGLYAVVDGYNIVFGRSFTQYVDSFIAGTGKFDDGFSLSVVRESGGKRVKYTTKTRNSSNNDLISIISYYREGVPYMVGFKYGYATGGRSGSDFHNTSIELPMGITDKSTISEVLNAYGAPEKYYNDTKSGIAWYLWRRDQNHFLRLAFEGLDPDTAVISDIYMFQGNAHTILSTIIDDEANDFIEKYGRDY